MCQIRTFFRDDFKRAVKDRRTQLLVFRSNRDAEQLDLKGEVFFTALQTVRDMMDTALDACVPFHNSGLHRLLLDAMHARCSNP